MVAPAKPVREACYRRDHHRCVRCGRDVDPTFQHRAAVGMGGSTFIPTAVDGVTACIWCNEAFEHRLQREALASGWKVRRWVHEQGRTAEIPVFYKPERQWCLLIANSRMPISEETAISIMHEIYGDEYDEWRA